ncbi:transposase [Hymenobacter setariae]|uniref:Transposase n=1 Tax=Hymenobacter setariae TaxID=2594794 RepID=A0A558BRZ3_9BACT|nr:transposase [Hymenobacter setariae]TVT39287.1 transposase [Hymenobacter setariae]
MTRYQFIEQVATTEPVQMLCCVLEVSAAGYYLSSGAGLRAWEPAATAAFSHHAQRYGTRRLRAELRAEGYAIGRYCAPGCVAAAYVHSARGHSAPVPP